jgi:hypothetical protein
MRINSCNSFVALAAIAFASCTETEPGKSEDNRGPATGPAVEAGCYLGHQSAGGDSILVQLDAQLNGRMEISIPEKDRRSGTLQGIAGTDGIVRATYRFTQEGMTDSIQVQFRQEPGSNALQLRPSAYDPASGREYPDSSKDFSLVLSAIPCK